MPTDGHHHRAANTITSISRLRHDDFNKNTPSRNAYAYRTPSRLLVTIHDRRRYSLRDIDDI